METLYSSWNPGEQYHLTTLSNTSVDCGGTSSSLSSSSPSSSSSSSSSSSTATTVAALMPATSYLVACDTPPTPITCDSGIFNNNTNGNMFYSPTQMIDQSSSPMVNNINHDQTNMDNINYDDYQQQTINYNDVVPSDYYNDNNLTNGQSSFLSHHHHHHPHHPHTNYSIPTSMESPANTSYSSPSPSPDLWENYGLNESVKHVNQTQHCNLDQQLNLQHQQQPVNHHQHLQQTQQQNQLHHHQHLHQHHSIVTNYHNQPSAQQQIQHQNNLDNNKSTYTSNDDIITTTANNNNSNSAINTINNNHNKDVSVKAKNTINPINKSTNYRGSYKIKKSQIDTNFIKVSTGNHRNNHQHHHRSIESRSGGNYDKFISPEDEERRRRRRERNKVAATKCRNKKKVHVYKLCQESQTLESTNYNLKEEMENLKREEQRLNDILVKHLPFCVRRTLQPIQ